MFVISIVIVIISLIWTITICNKAKQKREEIDEILKLINTYNKRKILLNHEVHDLENKELALTEKNIQLEQKKNDLEETIKSLSEMAEKCYEGYMSNTENRIE